MRLCKDWIGGVPCTLLCLGLYDADVAVASSTLDAVERLSTLKIASRVAQHSKLEHVEKQECRNRPSFGISEVVLARVCTIPYSAHVRSCRCQYHVMQCDAFMCWRLQRSTPYPLLERCNEAVSASTLLSRLQPPKHATLSGASIYTR